jgi:hypothetical protein
MQPFCEIERLTYIIKKINKMDGTMKRSEEKKDSPE